MMTDFTEKRTAREAVAYAIRAGRLERGSCAQESPECRGQIEGHHPDYSKPLDVVWLCDLHHKRETTGDRCPNGHEPDWYVWHGWRHCRACRKERMRDYYHRVLKHKETSS